MSGDLECLTRTRDGDREEARPQTAAAIAMIAAPAAAGDLRPWARIADALRRHIASGAVPPGTKLEPGEIAARHRTAPMAARKALGVLREEGLVTHFRYRWYAAPAGRPAPITGARLGSTLAALRKAAGLSIEELAAAARTWPEYIGQAEADEWQPREFWQQCDDGLGADGTLIRLHDNYYGARADDDDHHDDDHHNDQEQASYQDEGHPDAPEPQPAKLSAPARVAAEIAARIGSGEWAPGARLPSQGVLADDHAASQSTVYVALRDLAADGIVARTDLGYFIPGERAPDIPTVTQIILRWSDGTQTRAHPDQ